MARRDERPLTCEEVPALVRTFVSVGLPGHEGRRLRAHVQACDACRAVYRDGVETAAHIGHERRVERVATEKAVRRWSLRRDVFTVQSTRRGRGARLRTVLYPALFFLFILQLADVSRYEPLLSVEVLEGEVHGSEHLQHGELCATGPDGRARLTSRGSSLEVGPDTRLLVESASQARVRLLSGSLSLRGSWRVTTDRGVVDLEEGEARVTLDGEGLTCEGEDGELTILDAAGETPVRPGQRVVMAR